MICICCGFRIEDETHQTSYGPVCERCWNDPNLFFPEKLVRVGRWEGISDLMEIKKGSKQKTLIVPVIKVKQKKVTLYTGKLKAKEILQLYGIYGFEELTLQGYQRELYENKVKDLYDYLVNCDVAVMPGVFISVRNGVEFISSSERGDIGELKIPLEKGSIWIIDGQHRVGCFENILANVAGFHGEDSSQVDSFTNLMNYELPVTFIDSLEAVKRVNNENEINIAPADIERMLFFLINKTHKRISPSLGDTLQYCIRKAGVNGIPAIERNMWRTYATHMAIKLNSLEESPLYKKINISGRRGVSKPIRLNSFVSSLKPLYMNDFFLKLSNNEKLKLLLSYWDVIKSMYEEAFSEKTRRNYLILKALGVYSLNWLCSDFLNWCVKKELIFFSKITIENYLKGIKDFDWSKETSPFANFGGMKGVKEAHSILLEIINGQMERVST